MEVVVKVGEKQEVVVKVGVEYKVAMHENGSGNQTGCKI